MKGFKKNLPNIIKPRAEFLISDLIETDFGKNLVVGLQPSTKDIFMQSNDYLDISNDQKIRNDLIRELDKNDSDVFMSSIFLQDNNNKYCVEKEYADFVNFDNCYISQSGWNANISLFQTICSPDTNVYIDFFCHMSMWEGARYANAKIHPFMHNNCAHLRKLIKRNGPGIIVVDSIYSTVGTVAPLVDIISIAKEFECATVVDESHSLGVFGEHGSGLLNELGLSAEVDFMTASLAKAFAYRAGVVWTNNEFGQCIPYASFPSIFSSTMMNYEMKALQSTLDVIKSADIKRSKLLHLSKRLRTGLLNIGINIRSQSQIVTLETKDERNTKNIRNYLEERHIFGSVFCRPATPKNSNILRLSVNSSISEEQIDKIILTCEELNNDKHYYFK